MQNTWTYPAVFEREGDEVVVHFPDVPEALTGASTMEEARLLAADALEEAILHYLAEGMPIPLPRAANKGEEAVALDPISAGRAAVAILMAQGRISNVALADRMAKDEKVVRRIVSGKGNVTMQTITVALKALGASPALVA
jgi:antitoxin HicB